MLQWLIGWRIARFERAFDYDMSYVRALAKASPRAFMDFAKVVKLANLRWGAPRDTAYAAKLAAAMAEDCGPCTQFVATMAEREGMAAGQLRAILTRDERAMNEETALGFRFAEAVLAHDPAAEELRDEIARRWGQRAVVALGLAIAMSRVFPTLKYALGYGKACTRVTIAGSPLPVLRKAA
jgi:hypothetical protein